MAGVTYDTGALLAAERSDRRMWALHAGYVKLGAVPTVPAPVLAEAWRGGSRQAQLSRLLAVCNAEPMTEEQARKLGGLSGRTSHNDVVDVAVVEGAIRRSDAIVTADEDDIRRIVQAAGATLNILSP